MPKVPGHVLDALVVEPGSAADLAGRPHAVDLGIGRDELKESLAGRTAELAVLQERLYSGRTHAVLVVFQAMDAAGKDSTIAHVMSGINPQGCRVVSFKQPSADELAHDFLWRASRALPPRGVIGVFNRSHYEETLVVRVHPELLAPQRLPGGPKPGKRLWKERYEDINDFERHLDRNGTTVLKFFLHVSKEEQRKRLLARLDDPEKRWKFDVNDVDERAYWDDYQAAYEDTITATSTAWAPWRVVPADDKPTMRTLVAEVMIGVMRGLDGKPFVPGDEESAAMEQARQRLLAED